MKPEASPGASMGASNLALVGSGWHPPLFREEARSLLGPIEVLHPRMVSSLQSGSELSRISYASLVDEVIVSTSSLCIDDGEITASEIAMHVGEWAQSFLPEGSFAVRARNLGQGVCNLSRREIEAEIGARISGESRPVDLDNPDFEIAVVLAGRMTHQDTGKIHSRTTSSCGG